MSVSLGLLTERIQQVQERISDAAARAGRDPADVQLVTVTKTHGIEVVESAYLAGLRHFGENRVEEAEGKITALSDRLPESTWHMIGHIQSRKTAQVASLFPWVHSVDRFKIARRLSDAVAETGGMLNIMLEVNISGEASKYGYHLAGWPEEQASFQALLEDVRGITSLPGIRLHGLMTMAPFTDEPETVRPVFRRLRQLRDALQERLPAYPLPHLSMGMSSDFEVAIEEGATIVRLGTILLGPRNG